MNSVVSVKIPKGWTGEPPVSGTDIAILKLNTKVNFILNNEKNAIMPACLPNRRVHNNVYNQEAYTAGNFPFFSKNILASELKSYIIYS